MIITSKKFSDIIEKILEEQDFSFMTDRRRNDLYKKLLLYVEYTMKYYTLVENYLTSIDYTDINFEKSAVAYLRTIINNPEYVQLAGIVNTLSNKGIPEYSRIIPIVSHALSLLSNYVSSYVDIPKDPKENITSAEKFYANFYKTFQNYFNSLSSILVKIREKFSDSATSNIDTSSDTPKIEIANLFGDLDGIINRYLSEIILVFRKFDSIRIESGEYAKKWEDFNLLRGYAFYKKGINVVNDPAYAAYPTEIKQKVADYFKDSKQTPNRMINPRTYNFKVPIFIQTLLKGKYVVPKEIKDNPGLLDSNIYPTRELEKAASIDASLKKIFGWSPIASSENPNGKPSKDSLEGMIGDILKKLHTVLWDSTKNIYTYNEELKNIIQILFNVKKLYKSSLNKIVSNMDRLKNGSLDEIFNANGPIQDVIIKYVQFAKLNVKNIYLNLVSASGVTIDVEKYQALFSKQEEPAIAQRLAYWALFQRLGWTKGLKSEEAPDWLYGEGSSDSGKATPEGVSPGPGTTPVRKKRKVAKVTPKVGNNNIVLPIGTPSTP